MATDITISGSTELVLDMGDSATLDDLDLHTGTTFTTFLTLQIRYHDVNDLRVDDDGTPIDAKPPFQVILVKLDILRPEMRTPLMTSTLKLEQPLKKFSLEQPQTVWIQLPQSALVT